MEPEIARLKRIEAAARALVEASPIGDDDLPYASDIVGPELKALAESLIS